MSTNLSDIIVFIMFCIPLLGAMHISINKAFETQKLRNRKPHPKITLLLLLAIFMFITLALFSFAIVFCFFPQYRLPIYIKIYNSYVHEDE